MSGVQRGRTSGRPARDKLIEKHATHVGVQVRGRLVEQVQRGLPRQRPSETDALLLTAGQLARPPVGQLTDVQQGQDPPCLGLGLGRAMRGRIG